MNNRNNTPAPKERQCYFCTNNLKEVDYKEAGLIRRFTSSYGKIAPRRRSGACAKHQRKLATAVKRARVIALLPFVTK